MGKKTLHFSVTAIPQKLSAKTPMMWEQNGQVFLLFFHSIKIQKKKETHGNCCKHFNRQSESSSVLVKKIYLHSVTHVNIFLTKIKSQDRIVKFVKILKNFLSHFPSL